MNGFLRLRPSEKNDATRKLASTLRQTLDHKYSCVLQSAESEYGRRFAGKDPSDACVTVRIAPRRAGKSISNYFRNAA